MTAAPVPKTSIVIATDGRPDALDQTLKALQYLEGPDFEVIVVNGPTDDGTDVVLERWGDAIKVMSNSERNLSQSRNIGIKQAAGDLIAFIDDDGVPEPEWLQDITNAFDAPDVAGVGGLVKDHTGWGIQYKYASANRLGNSNWGRTTPADDFNFPYSFNFPYLQGTNSVFRRSMLLEIGAFDEEYEFYLDETDVCCRMVDKGWRIRQLTNAVVHHKFLPSKIRDSNRITRARYAVLKNKLYFSLINNHGHYPLKRALEDMMHFAEGHRADLRHHCEAGRLDWSDMDMFEADLDRAWDEGLRRGLSQERRILQPGDVTDPPPFRMFPKLVPTGERKHYAFASAEYPPDRTGGVGRYIHQLATEVAALGHHVRVVAHTDGHPTSDFEDGVWVDRIPPWDQHMPPDDLDGMPPRIWQRSATVRDRLDELDKERPLSLVYAPVWDCEGMAMLRQDARPLVVGLQTTLKFWLDSQPNLKADKDFMTRHGTPMLAVEQDMIETAHGLHSISQPLLKNVTEAYGIAEGDPRAEVIQLGLEDWTTLPAQAPVALPKGALRILFVGRLELRKGIDVLLDVAPGLLETHDRVYFDIVGNDTIPGPDGLTFRAAFEMRDLPKAVMERVRFHGEVSEEALRGLYAACDIMVGPSRYESFGLMLVEGMMFSKPVVGCAAGGMLEVVEPGVSGHLAEPGDAGSLRDALEQLLGDPAMRDRLGQGGRARYQEKFTARTMAESVVAFLQRIEHDWRRDRAIKGRLG